MTEKNVFFVRTSQDKGDFWLFTTRISVRSSKHISNILQRPMGYNIRPGLSLSWDNEQVLRVQKLYAHLADNSLYFTWSVEIQGARYKSLFRGQSFTVVVWFYWQWTCRIWSIYDENVRQRDALRSVVARKRIATARRTHRISVRSSVHQYAINEYTWNMLTNMLTTLRSLLFHGGETRKRKTQTDWTSNLSVTVLRARCDW